MSTRGTEGEADASVSLIRASWGLLPEKGWVPDCEVLVRGATIEWVGQGTDGEARPDFGDVPVLSFPDGAVIPGLVDAHVHLTFSGSSEVIQTLSEETDLTLVARALGAAQAGLRHGVTTQVDCGSRGRGLYAVRDAIDSGLAVGPRLLVSGAPITTTAGHCHWLGGSADGYDDVLRAIRTRVAEGADVVKLMLTGGNMTAGSNPRALQFPPPTMKAVGQEAGRLGKPLVVHAHSEEAVVLAAQGGATVIAHATSVDESGRRPSDATLEAVLASGSFVDPTLMVAADGGGAPIGKVDTLRLQARMRIRQAMIPVFQRMHALGIPLLAGTDGGSTGVAHHRVAGAIRALHEEVGLSTLDALLAGTEQPANAYGIRDVTGAIEPGLAADLMVVGADVRTDLRRLEEPLAVWARGDRIMS